MASDQLALQQQVDALHQRGHSLRHADARQALQLCRQAHALALQAGYQRGLAWSLLRLGVCQLILGQAVSDDPLATVQQGLGLMRSLGDPQGEAEALNLLGNLFMDRQALDDALACHASCLALRRQLGDIVGEATSLHNMALAYRDLGQLPEALEHGQRSLALAESTQDGLAMAYALNSLAGLHEELGEAAQARAMLERALGLVAGSSDRALESTLRINLGRLLTQAGQLPAAAAELDAAARLAHTTGNSGDLALALLAQAQLHQAAARHDLAAPLLQQGLALAGQRADRQLLAQLLLAQAQAVWAGQGAAAALPLLQQALQQARAVRALALVALAHERLSQVQEALGDLRAALQHSRDFQQASGQLHGPASQRRIRALVSQQAVARAGQEVQSERQRSAALAEALADLQAEATRLQQLASEDGLTGVANRRWLDLQLPHELQRARRFHHPLVLAMVDIDHFKAVNDQHSHAVGDAALRAVASLLRSGCRASDLLGRYGGEEFLLVLVETAAAPALALCDKLRQRVATHDWVALQPGLGRITISIGLAALQPGDDVAALLARADGQLYRAKQAGRNQVCGCA